MLVCPYLDKLLYRAFVLTFHVHIERFTIYLYYLPMFLFGVSICLLCTAL